MDDIVIVGFGGHAKSLADCIERTGKYRIVGYTDIQEHMSIYSYLGTDDYLIDIFNKGVKNAAVGIGYLGKGDLRKRIYSHLKAVGFELPVIVDSSAIISASACIGEGTFIGKNVVVNAGAVVGRMAILNTMSLIEHDCVVGDYAHIAVSAVLCGQVKVGEAAFVGANATVIQCREVKDNQIVPAGATVR